MLLITLIEVNDTFFNKLDVCIFIFMSDRG